jgi:hypothetical protein
MAAIHGRFSSSLKRPRKQTAAQWLAAAESDARLMFHLIRGTLAYDPAFGADADAVEQQVHADNIDKDDIKAAEKVCREALLRVAHLDASAATFPDEMQAALVHGWARALQEEAGGLKGRIADFGCVALAVAVETAEDDLTAEQAAVVENPPVLRAMHRVDGRGAPYLGLSDEDAEVLHVMYADWKWPQAFISELLHCTTRKVRELLGAKGVSRGSDEAAIEATIVAIMNAGESGLGRRKIMGELKAKGIPHTRNDVARILRTLDPVGRDQRYRRRVPRVVYNIVVVNRMWHFDGYEHLVKWGIYAHGIICGASRCVVGLNVTDNKFSAPVAAFMMTAFLDKGVPRIVRCDRGTENVGVDRLVALLREAHYKIDIIHGPSTRNQRIERWWGDFAPYIEPVASVLESLGNDGILDVGDKMHMIAVHLVLLPYVTAVAARAVAAWNNHIVDTPGMKCTPQHKCE